jgi:hypothetical protein
MLGQEFELPRWLSGEQVQAAQESAARITRGEGDETR